MDLLHPDLLAALSHFMPDDYHRIAAIDSAAWQSAETLTVAKVPDVRKSRALKTINFTKRVIKRRDLLNMPADLRVLNMVDCEALDNSDIIHLPRGLKELHAKGTWNVPRSKFGETNYLPPNLEVLRLPTSIVDLGCLPKFLTTLEVSVSAYSFDMALLPKSLTYVKLANAKFVVNVDQCPRLTTLIVTAEMSLEQVEQLPCSLTNLGAQIRVNRNVVFPNLRILDAHNPITAQVMGCPNLRELRCGSIASVKHIPDTITRLSTSEIPRPLWRELAEFRLLKINVICVSGDISDVWGEMPRTLTSLTIHNYTNKHPDNFAKGLPRGLTKLATYWNSSFGEVDATDLPRSLKKLELGFSQTLRNLEALPNLKSLGYNPTDASAATCKALPRTLTKFWTINMHHTDPSLDVKFDINALRELPQSITTISVVADALDIFKALPNLKELSGMCDYAMKCRDWTLEHIAHMPPGITWAHVTHTTFTDEMVAALRFMPRFDRWSYLSFDMTLFGVRVQVGPAFDAPAAQ